MLTVRYIDENSATHTVKNVQRIFLREIQGAPYLYLESMNDEEGKGTEVKLRGTTSWDAKEVVSGGAAKLLL